MKLVHALIGCGRVAPNHIDGFARVPECVVEWACDCDAAALSEFVARYSIPRVSTDYQEVLSDPGVHSVSIAVGHGGHAEIAAAALKAGKHVLLEKPLAIRIEDGVALVDLAREHRRVLSVVSQHRFDPLVLRIRSWMAEGLIGRLLFVATTLECERPSDYYRESPWRGRWATEGGSALINQGYHYIDLMRWFGGRVVRAEAFRGTLRHGDVIETEDTLAGLLQFESGALGTIAVTTGAACAWRSRIEISGTTGSVSFDLDHPDTLHRAHGNRALETAADALLVEPIREEPPPGLTYYGVSHRRQIAEFCHAVRNGGQVLVNPSEAQSTLEVIAALYESAGRPHDAC